MYGIEVELHETIVLLRVHDCTAMFVNNSVQQLVQKQHSCYDIQWLISPSPFVWLSLMSIVCGFGSSNIVTTKLTIPNTFVSHCMQPLYLSRHDLKPPPPAIYPKLQTIHFMVGFGVLATYTGCMQMPNANELPLQVRRFNLRCGQPLKCLVCGITLRHGVHGTVWASTTLLQGGHLNDKHITNSLNCWIGELSQFAMHALYSHAGNISHLPQAYKFWKQLFIQIGSLKNPHTTVITI